MQTAVSITPWIITAVLGVVNLIFAIVVIPTRNKVVNMEKEFHNCQISRQDRIAAVESDIAHYSRESVRHDNLLAEISSCLKKLDRTIAVVEATLKANTTTMTEVKAELNSFRNGRGTTKA